MHCCKNKAHKHHHIGRKLNAGTVRTVKKNKAHKHHHVGRKLNADTVCTVKKTKHISTVTLVEN